VKRLLVTTALEETWPDNNQPVLFLGEWCSRYSRKEKWGEMNVVVAPYHWDDRMKLYSDYKKLQILYENILDELTGKLNQIHSINQSSRYWRIIIGPWLGSFIQILFDKWFMLKQTIEQSEIHDCKVIYQDILSVVPNDMDHFNKMIVDDRWHEAIYGQLLETYWNKEIAIEKIMLKGRTKHVISTLRGRMKIFLKKWAKQTISFYNKSVSMRNDYFFISSYLPLKADLILQIRLGQLPKYWRKVQSKIVKPDFLERQWSFDDNEKKATMFETVLKKMIPIHIPTVYLEGYKELVMTVNNNNWPKNPKAIFTSNNYLTDDYFKVWAAGKTQSGTPLIIGQHGGHFGMTPFAFHEEHQIKIADKWISWGWDDKNRPQIIPFGNLKTLGANVGYDPNGNALMVEMTLPRYSYHMYAAPVADQWLSYFEDQKKFIQALPGVLKKKLLVRLSPTDYGWDQERRWRDQFPEVKIDIGNKHIRKLIKRCRIYISTYNATTYLESLSWNVPTIIFWNPAHWEINEDAKPYFDILKSTNIFHESPESAAQHMAAIWDDVGSWWKSNEVQSARRRFCEMYSKTPKNPLQELVYLFRETNSIID